MMLELFPEGFEEVEHAGRRRAGRLHRSRRRGAALAGIRRRARPRTSSRTGRTAGAPSTGRCASDGSGSARRGRSPPDGATAIVIDPGRAFGTGAHRDHAALPRAAARARAAGALLDVGCGSGVLAIAAAKLGFDPVHRASTPTRARSRRRSRNAAANGVEIEARRRRRADRRAARRGRRRREHRAGRRSRRSRRLDCGRASSSSGYLARTDADVPAGFDARPPDHARGWAADLLRA